MSYLKCFVVEAYHSFPYLSPFPAHTHNKTPWPLQLGMILWPFLANGLREKLNVPPLGQNTKLSEQDPPVPFFPVSMY